MLRISRISIRPTCSNHYSRLPYMTFLLTYHVGLATNIFSHMIYERDSRELCRSCDVFVSRTGVPRPSDWPSHLLFYDKILSNDSQPIAIGLVTVGDKRRHCVLPQMRISQVNSRLCARNRLFLWFHANFITNLRNLLWTSSDYIDK